MLEMMIGAACTSRQAAELLGDEPAWTAFDKDDDRETLFEEWILELRRQEKVLAQFWLISQPWARRKRGY